MLFGLLAPVYALSCDEVLNMVQVAVPENIMVQVIQDSGEHFDAAVIACLEKGGAPATVLAAATAQLGLPDPPPVPDSLNCSYPKDFVPQTLRLAGYPHTAMGVALQDLEQDPRANWCFLFETADMYGGAWRLRGPAANERLEKVPATIRSRISYAAGVYWFEQNQRSKALRSFQEVSETSPDYLNSKFMEAMVYLCLLQDRVTNGIRLMQSIVRDPNASDELVDLAILQVAQTYCDSTYITYENGLTFYDLLHSPTADLEEAWCRLRAGQATNVAVSLQHWQDRASPEFYWLQAVEWFYTIPITQMHLQDALPFARAYAQAADPVAKALAEVENNDLALDDLREAIRSYAATHHAQPRWPRWVLEPLSKHQDLADADAVSHALNDEYARIVLDNQWKSYQNFADPKRKVFVRSGAWCDAGNIHVASTPCPATS